MNAKGLLFLAAGLLGLLVADTALAQAPLGTQITYQGELKSGGVAVDDVADLRFALYDAATGGNLIATDTEYGVAIVAGKFTAQPDFGAGVFTGQALWLEIGVAIPVGGAFVTLSGRQPLTPAPYALFALDGGGSESLWQSTGSHIYYNAGNVGIGNTAPGHKLVVEASYNNNVVPLALFRTTGSNSAGAIRFENAAGSHFNLGITANDELALAHNANISLPTDLLRISPDGYFGLGTTTPQRRLHVRDASSTTAALIQNDGSGNALRLEAAGTALVALGDVHGVEAWSDGVGTSAIFGGSTASTGAGTGVYGYSNGPDGRGLYGEAVGANALGIYGYASADSGNATGVKGVTDSTGGFGVWGVANATSGVAEGGRFVSNSTSGRGVYGSCTATTGTNYGVIGVTQSTSGVGVWGAPQATSGSTVGVRGTTLSPTGIAVKGESFATSGANCGVYGSSAGGTGSVGVWGHNAFGWGGKFTSDSGYAASFEGTGGISITHDAGGANTAGVSITSTGTEEPVGLQVNVDAYYGRLADFELDGADLYIGTAFKIAADNAGNVVEVFGENAWATENVLQVQSAGYGSAIYGYNSRDADDTPAVHGYHISSTANFGVGVKGEGGYMGVQGRASGGDGTGTKYGVYGYATNGATNYAGYFSGNLRCTGTLTKGSGTFMIDHPLDPANKYLYHSFVESPDMLNIYNGNVVLDEHGEAVVTLPAWFEALNMEFRYQLTCIGGFAQVYIAEEIANNQFKIAGGKGGLKVSWQVTGVRHDPFANANRVQVEVDKPDEERGTYLHPEAWGAAAELQVDRVREARETRATDVVND